LNISNPVPHTSPTAICTEQQHAEKVKKIGELVRGTGGADPVGSGMWELDKNKQFAHARVRYLRNSLALPGDKSLLPGKWSHHLSQEVVCPVPTVRKTIETNIIFYEGL
jgi:hypothetical protein